MQPLEVRVMGGAPGDRYSDEMDAETDRWLPSPVNVHPLDREDARKELRMLLGWFYLERERQAENRLEMSLDCDAYDSKQWDEEDERIVESRGQMALVYNEIAPMVDWIIGTERRTRVDWSILPRGEEDVSMADIKEKVLKYISDINRVPFVRSRAFSDAVKCGVGWIDDGVSDDPTSDILYSKYEDWRNILWDSSGYELDLSDCRYIFRWRWVDEDIACAMFPDRADKIRKAVQDAGAYSLADDEDAWLFGDGVNATPARSGKLYAYGKGVAADTTRKRVRLIEAQYRMPTVQKVVSGGTFSGAFFHQDDAVMVQAVAREGAMLVDRVVMRTHFAVFTETDMLSRGVSIYRHNRFSLTPIWCYRRSRDRLPYGVIRRVRDIQQDLNKRASKALFLLNSNQIIAEDGAVDDMNLAREEIQHPDGTVIVNRDKRFEIRRDYDGANKQIEMMTFAAQAIQKTAGVNNENLGRQTNAISGAAIAARQQQGAVGTTEVFDNLRLAVQVQGEKQLSLAEQFYSEEKVIRVAGARGRVEWVKVNQPEVQADGSVRWLNDITASQADFVVSEQDYAGTLRQVMFESMNQIAGRVAPELAIRLLMIAFSYSDQPNKDEIVEEMRQMIGMPDPNKEPSPEEMQQKQAQMAVQSEVMQIQRESALLALEETRARVREINAKAAQIEAQLPTDNSEEYGAAMRKIQSQAADQIDELTEQLRRLQMDTQNKTAQINREADAKIEAARIQAYSNERIAEITAQSNKSLGALEERMQGIAEALKQGAPVATDKPQHAVPVNKTKDEEPHEDGQYGAAA